MKRKHFKNVRLLDMKHGGEFSANPDDYFMMKDSDSFSNTELIGDITKRGGWRKTVLIKRNPMKSDLQKLRKGGL